MGPWVCSKQRGERGGSAESGLKQRTRGARRRVSSQHRQLDVLVDLVWESLQVGAIHSARGAFMRFCDALEAHFEIEERQYFPAIRCLRPQAGELLAVLCSDHDELRGELKAVSSLLAAGDHESSSERLASLIARLADHETSEEQLFEDAVGHTD